MTKILIVEDQPAIAKALRMLFELHDVDSVITSDPDHAVRLIEKGEVGLVLQDMVVAATDYQGLGTPGPARSLIGLSAGRAVLDVARAARGLDAAGADWHLHVYANVKHGFTDPEADSHGIEALGYDASADRQSWAAMFELFDEVFG